MNGLKSVGNWVVGICTTLFIGVLAAYAGWIGTNIVAMRSELAVSISQQQVNNTQIVSRISDLAADVEELQKLAENDRFRISRLEFFRGKK